MSTTNSEQCRESYRRNFPTRVIGTDWENPCNPHVVAFKTGWAAHEALHRDEIRRSEARRKVAEDKLAAIIAPKQ